MVQKKGYYSFGCHYVSVAVMDQMCVCLCAAKNKGHSGNACLHFYAMVHITKNQPVMYERQQELKRSGQKREIWLETEVERNQRETCIFWVFIIANRSF